MPRRNSARVPRRTRSSRTPSIWDAVTVDVCSRTVTLLSSRYSVATLLAILDRVGVNASRLPMGHPLHDRSVRLFTMEDVGFVLLQMPHGQGLIALAADCPGRTVGPMHVRPSALASSARASPSPPPRTAPPPVCPPCQEREILGVLENMLQQLRRYHNWP